MHCVAKWYSSAVSSLHVGHWLLILTTPLMNMSLKRVNLSSHTTARLGDSRLADRSGASSAACAPTSSRRMSHWNDRKVCPTE